MWELLRHLNATCEDISALISQSMDQELSTGRRLAVRLHLVYCRACRRYRAQMELLRKVLRSEQPADPASAVSLSPEARARLKQVIEDSDPPV